MILEPTETRKQQIERVAAQLFSERGYHATTIREIARVLDLEGGSLYSHISGKQALLYDLVLRASEQFLRAASEVLAEGGTARSQLRGLMRRHLAIVAASTARAAVYFHEWRHLGQSQQATITSHRDQYEAAFRQIIRAGIAGGEFRPCDERMAALQVLSLLNWTYQWYDPAGPLDAEALADLFYAQVMGGLGF